MSLPRFFAKRVRPSVLEFNCDGNFVGYLQIGDDDVVVRFEHGQIAKFALMLAHVATVQWSDYIVEQGGDMTPVYYVGYTAEEFEAKWGQL